MRGLAWLLVLFGALCLLVGLLWFGYGLYVQHVVAASPATVSVIKTDHGDVRLGDYLAGDQLPAAAPTPGGADAASPEALPEPPRLATPSPPAAKPDRPILPPTRLLVPTIGVDAPVVLADNDNLPKFKGVGWYIGSGFPGFRGNMVLFGHLNGEFETFARLAELRPGDLVAVRAMERTYHYAVSDSKVVPKDAVEVMAPSADSRVTLITCTGTFYPATRDYSHRLIVVGALVAE